MRIDYFTASELSYLLHINSGKLRDIVRRKPGMPHCVVGGRIIFPKAKFFVWYDKMIRDGLLCEFLWVKNPNCNEVHAARDEWLRERYNVVKGAFSHGKQEGSARSK